MISKKGVEDIMLFMMLAISIVSLVFLYSMITSGINTACKSSQMDELGRVWKNLYLYNMSYDPARLSGYNRLPEPLFELKSTCVSELRYDYTKDVINVKWRDTGQDEEMPAMGTWYDWDGNYLDGDYRLLPGKYGMVISYRNVTVLKPE